MLAAGAGRGPGDFGPALLRAGARHLAGERDALADFARRHFPGLGGPRDQAAAALALEHAVCSWLPALPAAEAEVRVRAAVRGALARAVRLEEHWQARTMSTLLPAGDAQAAFDQAEGRVDAERLIAMAQVPPAERALLRALARGDGGWSAVRRCLPADLRTTDEAFYRWQRAARQRWQRALARIVRP